MTKYYNYFMNTKVLVVDIYLTFFIHDYDLHRNLRQKNPFKAVMIVDVFLSCNF